MKNILKLFLLISAAVASVSCGRSGQDGPQALGKMTGEWHLVSTSGLSDVPPVYVTFSKNLLFEIYQKTGDEVRYTKYEGTYSVKGSVVSGVYSDGETWACDYEVSFEGNNLVLTAMNGSKEVNTFEKKALSDSDKADARPYTDVRSGESSPRFL